jgi:hypothetical protein
MIGTLLIMILISLYMLKSRILSNISPSTIIIGRGIHSKYLTIEHLFRIA